MVFPSQTLPGLIQVATAGEALMDMLTEADGRLNPCEGGAVYNLTRALGLQGVGTLYLNPLSADGFGQRLTRGLKNAGVHLARTEAAALPTALAVVGLDAAGKASYSFYREGVADRDVSATGMAQACDLAPGLAVVATGCLALMPADTHAYLPWLQTQRDRGRLVVVDANLRPAVVADMAAYRRSVTDALWQAHIIKVSDDDLDTLGLLKAGKAPLNAVHALLQQTRAAAVALTLGAEGALWVDRHGHVWHAREAAPVTVADTVGAGDCFLAGLLAALAAQPDALQRLHTPPPHGPVLDTPTVTALLQRGVASASWCVQQTGCQPPSAAQVAERLKEHPAQVARLTPH
ncbi:carbohydrate kinase family protein [Hydrogenophaga soli]